MAIRVPGYWANEDSGVLAPVVKAYLDGRTLNHTEVAIMRAYLRQWMFYGDWRGASDLVARINEIRTRADLDKWLSDALELGIDPL